MVTLSVDIYLPAIPAIQEYFAATEQAAQMSFGFGFIACSIGALIFGPLSDRVGRKPVLIISTLIVLLGCLLCVYATSIYIFNAARFIQGIGVGGNWVLTYAILAESYDANKGALMVSYMGTLHTMMYFIAPNIGGLITAYLGWEWCFLFVILLLTPVLLMIMKFFPETLKKIQNHTLTQTYSQFFHMIQNKYFVAFGSVLSLVIGALLLPFASLPFIFKNLGIEEALFGVFLGAIPIAETFTTFLTRSLIKKHGLDFVLRFGLALAVFGSVSFFGVSVFAPSNPYLIMAALALFSTATPMLFPPVLSKCIAVFPDQKGTASALLSALRYLVIGSCAYFGSVIYDGTLIPASIGVMFVSVLAVLMWKISDPKGIKAHA